MLRGRSNWANTETLSSVKESIQYGKKEEDSGVVFKVVFEHVVYSERARCTRVSTGR